MAAPHRTDIELMLAAKEGEAESFNCLIGRHHAPMVNFFFRICRHAEEAEDLAQEVFLKLYLTRKYYEPRAAFTTFLYRIARTVWIDHYRRRKRRPILRFFGHSHEQEGWSAEHLAVEDGEGPEASLLRKETCKHIDETMNTLSEDHRMVLMLNIGSGLKYREIAEILDIPVGTVRSRIHYAMKTMRAKLKKMGVSLE